MPSCKYLWFPLWCYYFFINSKRSSYPSLTTIAENCLSNFNAIIISFVNLNHRCILIFLIFILCHTIDYFIAYLKSSRCYIDLFTRSTKMENCKKSRNGTLTHHHKPVIPKTSKLLSKLTDPPMETYILATCKQHIIESSLKVSFFSLRS
jgi:hypothetical protein